MKKFIQSNPVVSFVVITFLYSWTLWLLMILSNKHILPFYFPTNFLGSFGPAIGALIVTAVIAGKTGIKAIFRSLVEVKSSLWAFAFSCLLIVVLYAVTYAIHVLVEDTPLKLQTLHGIPELIVYFFVVAIIGGPLGEEIGWRGFLQGRLMDRFSPLVTSLLISLVWFAWHLPLFWLEGAAQKGDSLIAFELTVTAMSFLFTLLYIKTKGNLFQAVLFHTMINYISAILIPSLIPVSESDRAFGNLLTMVLVGAAIFYFLLYYKTFTRRPELQESDFEDEDIL